MKTLSITGSAALNDGQREVFHIKAVSPENNPARLRVAGYARVSSNSDDQLNSFSAQVKYYQTIIEQNPKWELCEIYADEGISGVSTEKRDDFNRMIADCKKGKIDRILTKSTSRFARNTLDAISVIRELQALGISVYFEKENIDTAKLSGENLFTLYSLFAQEESLSISKNCKRGVRSRMQSGTYISTNVPYGYRLVNKEPVIYEPEAEIVRRIFSEYLDGKGVHEIARGLTEDNIPRKSSGDKWRHQVILIILKNERYVGDMLFQKNYNCDALPYKTFINRGELPQYYVKESHEPIVSRIQFELANILLNERSVQNKQNVVEDHVYRRKICCKYCGTTYKKRITRGKNYWVCQNHDESKHNCESQRVPETSINEAFVRMYNKLKANHTIILLPILSQLERLRELKNKKNPELSTINKQIAELSEQNHVMNGLLSKGILDSALFISQTDELTRKIQSLKLAKSRLLDETDSDEALICTRELISILEHSPNQIAEMDPELFTDMVDKVVAKDTESIDFILINGLVLTERLE